MPTESHQISVWIDRPASEVYAYAGDPSNLPVWAPGLVTSIEHDDSQSDNSGWYVETPDGRVGIEFAPANDFGVLDHWVSVPSGDRFYNPMRAMVAGDGCEVLFTARRRPGMTDADVDADVAAVTADLARLKAVLEATGA